MTQEPTFQLYAPLGLRYFAPPWLFWGGVIGYCLYQREQGVLYHFVAQAGPVILIIITILTFIRGMKERTHAGEITLLETGLRLRIGEETFEIAIRDFEKLFVQLLRRTAFRLHLPTGSPGPSMIGWTQADLPSLVRTIESRYTTRLPSGGKRDLKHWQNTHARPL